MLYPPSGNFINTGLIDSTQGNFRSAKEVRQDSLCPSSHPVLFAESVSKATEGSQAPFCLWRAGWPWVQSLRLSDIHLWNKRTILAPCISLGCGKAQRQAVFLKHHNTRHSGFHKNKWFLNHWTVRDKSGLSPEGQLQFLKLEMTFTHTHLFYGGQFWPKAGRASRLV